MENQYKSPLRKLVKFFEKSRDQWKDKTLKMREVIKYYKNRVRFLESSKEELASKNKALKTKNEELEKLLKKKTKK